MCAHVSPHGPDPAAARPARTWPEGVPPLRDWPYRIDRARQPDAHDVAEPGRLSRLVHAILPHPPRAPSQ